MGERRGDTSPIQFQFHLQAGPFAACGTGGRADLAPAGRRAFLLFFAFGRIKSRFVAGGGGSQFGSVPASPCLEPCLADGRGEGRRTPDDCSYLRKAFAVLLHRKFPLFRF